MILRLLPKYRLLKKGISILSETNFQEVSSAHKIQSKERNLVRNKTILQAQTCFQERLQRRINFLQWQKNHKVNLLKTNRKRSKNT